jgi:hypothetical protein
MGPDLHRASCKSCSQPQLADPPGAAHLFLEKILHVMTTAQPKSSYVSTLGLVAHRGAHLRGASPNPVPGSYYFEESRRSNPPHAFSTVPVGGGLICCVGRERNIHRSGLALEFCFLSCRTSLLRQDTETLTLSFLKQHLCTIRNERQASVGNAEKASLSHPHQRYDVRKEEMPTSLLT